jgi:hypothetical protein
MVFFALFASWRENRFLVAAGNSGDSLLILTEFRGQFTHFGCEVSPLFPDFQEVPGKRKIRAPAEEDRFEASLSESPSAGIRRWAVCQGFRPMNRLAETVGGDWRSQATRLGRGTSSAIPLNRLFSFLLGTGGSRDALFRAGLLCLAGGRKDGVRSTPYRL